MVEKPEGSGFTFPVQCECDNGQVFYNLPPSKLEQQYEPRMYGMYDDEGYARPDYNDHYNYGGSGSERRIINEFLDEYGDDPGVSHAVETIIRDADSRVDLTGSLDRQDYITYHLLQLRDRVGVKRRRDSYTNPRERHAMALEFMREYADDPGVKHAMDNIIEEAKRMEREGVGMNIDDFIEHAIIRLREKVLESNSRGYRKIYESW